MSALIEIVKLNKLIKKTFNFSMDDIPYPKTKLYPIKTKRGDGLLIGTSNAVRHPYLVQGGIDLFLNQVPEEYFFIGFWGHGVNSYAFYYVRSDKKAKIFFRLPYGGAYMDNDAYAKRIPNFLFEFFDFENKLKDHVLSLYAVESMWMGEYEIILKEQAIKYKKSLYHSTDQLSKILKYLDIQ